MKAKTLCGIVGAIIPAVTIIAFALHLLMKEIQLNVVSWILWTILDIVLVITAIAAGNKRPWLPIGYTFGAAFVTIILWSRGLWEFGFAEGISVLGVVAALVVWRFVGAKGAIITASIAMTIAALPQAYDFWITPNPSTWWLWAFVAIGCFLSIVGARSWTIEDRFFPVASGLFNLSMTILVLR
ncbi:MAG: hypothetical protein HQ402_01990 [Parcubacteria group bacterium]|nr:hypothetical protein [Parcubacteria group bacterium]